MQRTFFSTPVLNKILKGISFAYMKIFGWEVTGEVPKDKKLIVTAYPHTTNWDMPHMLFTAFILGFESYWMGKDALFRGPAGPIMRWMGGIAIDRSKNNNVVDAMVNEFNKRDEMFLVIPPEGTRGYADGWKSGFYHIACGAGVPIMPSYLDYKNKRAGIGPLIWPSGDIDADMQKLADFYEGQHVHGKFQQNVSPIKIRSSKKKIKKSA